MIAIIRFMAMMLLVMVPSFVKAGLPSDLDIKIAIALSEAEVAKVKVKNYTYFYQQSIDTGIPLVVWVGQPERSIPGCLTYRVSSFDSGPKIGAIIAIPKNGKLWRVRDIEGTPTIAQIQKIIQTQTQTQIEPIRGVTCIGGT